MYLWSIEIESVLTAMSCFEFLCEEADILYSGDEQVIHHHLPNYAVYQEIAGTYKKLTTGACHVYDHIDTVYQPTPTCTILGIAAQAGIRHERN
mgnify:FL=1